MHTTRAPSLCTRTTSPALLHMTVRLRCLCRGQGRRVRGGTQRDVAVWAARACAAARGRAQHGGKDARRSTVHRRAPEATRLWSCVCACLYGRVRARCAMHACAAWGACVCSSVCCVSASKVTYAGSGFTQRPKPLLAPPPLTARPLRALATLRRGAALARASGGGTRYLTLRQSPRSTRYAMPLASGGATGGAAQRGATSA